MLNIPIFFDTIEQVKQFNQAITPFSCDFDLISGRYIVDAKSLLGIYSLDLSKPLELLVHTDDASETAKIREAVAPYVRE